MSLRRRMRSLPLSQIQLTDKFWARYQRVLVEVTLLHCYQELIQTGRVANFERAAGQAEGDFQGLWFNDSDVYKHIEGAAYALAAAPAATSTESKATVLKQMNHLIAVVAAAQAPDGYLNTFIQVRHPAMRWKNLQMMHEMYCAGHLFEAAVAVFENLGDRKLLDVAIKFADHIDRTFGPGKRLGYCGHEEIELALIRLAEATGQPKYRTLARWMVESRGSRPSPFETESSDKEAMALWPHSGSLLHKGGRYDGEYAQDHLPIREQTEVVGHAVRAMYYFMAATDLAEDAEDPKLEEAITNVWNNLTKKRMYLTGGIGPSASNEGFTGDYDLPNLSAYAETCAACGLVFWGHRLLQHSANGEYAEIMERALFNGVLSGISLSGDKFFYTNPLESRGTHQRTPWFECACCPPNVARLIGSVSHYMAGVDEKAFHLHIPASMKVNTVINGVKVAIDVESNYPWQGKFEITVQPERPVSFALHIRIPEWVDDVNFELVGSDDEAGFEAGYAVFDRTWSGRDLVKVEFEMVPRWLESDPRVRENLGRTALTYGPLVYCAEAKDLGYAPQLFIADPEAEVGIRFEKGKLEGVNVLTAEGVQDVELFVDDLYAPLGTTDNREGEAEFIPYFAWNNRGATHMQVWVRRL